MYTNLKIIKDGIVVAHYECESKDWTDYIGEAKQNAPCSILLCDNNGDVFQKIHIKKA